MLPQHLVRVQHGVQHTLRSLAGPAPHYLLGKPPEAYSADSWDSFSDYEAAAQVQVRIQERHTALLCGDITSLGAKQYRVSTPWPSPPGSECGDFEAGIGKLGLEVDYELVAQVKYAASQLRSTICAFPRRSQYAHPGSTSVLDVAITESKRKARVGGTMRGFAGVLAKHTRLNTCDRLPPLVVFVGPEAIDDFTITFFGSGPRCFKARVRFHSGAHQPNSVTLGSLVSAAWQLGARCIKWFTLNRFASFIVRLGARCIKGFTLSGLPVSVCDWVRNASKG